MLSLKNLRLDGLCISTFVSEGGGEREWDVRIIVHVESVPQDYETR